MGLRRRVVLRRPLDDAALWRRGLTEAMDGVFARLATTPVEFAMPLSRADVTRVIAMGPSAFHGAPADDPRIAALPETTEVTASVTVSVFAPA